MSKCNHVMVNDGGTSLVCKKCGLRTTTRQYALCTGFLLLDSSVSDLMHLRLRTAFNHFRGAELFFKISSLNYYEALDMLSRLRFEGSVNHSDLSTIIKIVFCLNDTDSGNKGRNNQDGLT